MIKKGYSILLTAYKTQDYIEECLDSIKKQTFFKFHKNYEILLGIDGCKETLEKVLEIRSKYRNLKIFMMNENRGTYITMNTLLDYVSYDNIIRFDTDDIMRVDMIYSINKYVNNIQICRLSCKSFGDEITDKIQSVDGVILIKKYIMDIAGGYKDWRCAADSELIYRLRNFYLVNDIPLYLFKRRIHNDSLTNNNDTNFQSSIRKEYRDYIFSKRYTKNDIYINKVINKNIKKY